MRKQRGEKFNKIIRFFAKIESQSEFGIKLYDNHHIHRFWSDFDHLLTAVSHG